ncbi:MAG: lactococcin 972 family bacteriocin [Lactovum sp.]
MKNIKKVLISLAVIMALAAGGVTASAATWNYGYRLGSAYSHYYHESMTHSATVVNRDTGNYGKATARSGAWAKASISLPWVGGRASFYYDQW